MGEIEPRQDGRVEPKTMWAVFTTLERPGSPQDGLPIDTLTTENTFSLDEKPAAYRRAADIIENPSEELSADLKPDDSVNVRVEKYERTV